MSARAHAKYQNIKTEAAESLGRSLEEYELSEKVRKRAHRTALQMERRVQERENAKLTEMTRSVEEREAIKELKREKYRQGLSNNGRKNISTNMKQRWAEDR